MDFTAFLLHEEPQLSDEEIFEHIEESLERETPPSLIEDMGHKLATAYASGIALAKEHGTRAFDVVVGKEKTAFPIRGATSAELKTHAAKLRTLAEETEKTAMLPLLGGMAARMVGGQVAKQGIKSIAGDVAKNMVVDKATSALSRPRPIASAQAPAGGFKYAFLLSSIGNQAKNFASGLGGKAPGTLGQKLVGGMVRNPGAALVGAGMIGGAVTAPRDPVTGEKQYIRGAITGGALGGGAYALGAGNKLRHAVVSPKGPQIFGERAGTYAREATKATGPTAARAAAKQVPVTPPPGPTTSSAASAPPTAPPAAAPVPPKPEPPYAGGPIRGTPKLANRQTLTYDPVSKSFTRTHLTASPAGDLSAIGVADIPAGHSAPVGRQYTEAPPRPLATPRASATPPPIPAAAMRPKSPISVGAGAAVKAAPKPPALPSLAGARSLVRR